MTPICPICATFHRIEEAVAQCGFACVLPGLMAEPERAGLVIERLRALSG